MSTDVLVPRVLWAQRKDIVYLTFEVFEVKEEKVEINDQTVNFSGTRSSDGAKFAVSLELYGGVDAENSKIRIGHRDVALVLKKKDVGGPFWPRLLKTTQKMHFIQTDFSKWIDEDEEDEQQDLGDYSNFDMSQFADAGGMGNFGGMGEDADEMDDHLSNEEEDNEEEEGSTGCEDENCSHDHGVKISGLTKDNKSFDA